MAANIKSLNALHDKLTQMFTKYLDRHLADPVLSPNPAEDAVDEIMVDLEPSPAMLAVIAKFLKDNDVTAEPETVDNLQEMRRSLEDKRKSRRKTLADLSIDAHMGSA